MDYVISYDISNDKKRVRIARILDDYGKRVQESVFELAGLRDTVWKECVNRLREAKMAEGESIRIYGLCRDCKSKIIVIGEEEEPMEAPDRYIV